MVTLATVTFDRSTFDITKSNTPNTLNVLNTIKRKQDANWTMVEKLSG